MVLRQSGLGVVLLWFQIWWDLHPDHKSKYLGHFSTIKMTEQVPHVVLWGVSQVSKEQSSNKTKKPSQIMHQGERNPSQYLQAGSPRHEALD